MGSAITRLLIILNDESPLSTDYVIALRLIENFSDITKLTIQGVADICNVSKSKISKFIRKIGYDDYLTFKAEISFNSNLQEKMNFNHLLRNINKKGIDTYLDTVVNDVEKMKNTLDLFHIDKLAGDLYSYKYIAAFGTLHSAVAALQLQFRLAYRNKFIITIMNDTKQKEFIESAKNDTLIIIFSDTGNYINVEQLQEGNFPKSVFNKTKAKVVLITSNRDMINNSNIDYSIFYDYTSNIHTYSVLYSLLTDLIAFRYDIFLQNLQIR